MDETSGKLPVEQQWRLQNPLAWTAEFLRLGRRRLPAQIRLMGLAILVGVVAGVGAIAFYALSRLIEYYALFEIVGYRPPVHPAGETDLSWLPQLATDFRPWLLLLVPTVGGLISGFLVYTFAPEAEGHGTDAVISAYHNKQGLIRPRVPIVKIIASAVTLGTGGSGGREGPIAQIGAGFGSALANMLGLRPTDRRVLDGGWHGRRDRRHLSRPAGRSALRRGGAVLVAGIRA